MGKLKNAIQRIHDDAEYALDRVDSNDYMTRGHLCITYLNTELCLRVFNKVSAMAKKLQHTR